MMFFILFILIAKDLHPVEHLTGQEIMTEKFINDKKWQDKIIKLDKIKILNKTDNLKKEQIILGSQEKSELSISKEITHEKISLIKINQKIIPEKTISRIFLKKNVLISENAEMSVSVNITDEFIFCPVGYSIYRKNNSITIHSANNISAIIALHRLEIYKEKYSEKHCDIRDLVFFENIKQKGIVQYLNENKFSLEKMEFELPANKLEIAKFRMYSYKPEVSDKLKEILNYTPVIFGTGLWSDIESATSLAEFISENGFELYKIELSGSPYTDCETCVNYDFSTITGTLIPIYLNKIQSVSGKEEFTYIGHSNGCRSMIYYLKDNDDPRIKNIIGNACPTEFDGNNLITNTINKKSEDVFESFKKKNLTHITFSDVKKIIIDIPIDSVGKEKISTNLLRDYFSAIKNTDPKEMNFSRINLENALIIYGEIIPDSDIIVFTKDPIKIFNTINAKKKKLVNFPLDHISIAEEKRVMDEILRNLEEWN